MKYEVKKYNTDLVIEADRFVLLRGHQESGSMMGYGATSRDWVDVAFYRNEQEDPVAFVQQPYSVTEVIDES